MLSVLAAGLLAVFTTPAMADVRLARIFGSHMVLQRDMPLPVWGWAEPGEHVTVGWRAMTSRPSPERTGNGRSGSPPCPQAVHMS